MIIVQNEKVQSSNDPEVSPKKSKRKVSTDFFEEQMANHSKKHE
jgi:hypothetical protein